MNFAHCSELGGAARNEDVCASLPELHLFVVCDGLGKDSAERASRVAIHVLQAYLEKQGATFGALRASPKKESRRALQAFLAAGVQEASSAVFTATGKGLLCTTMDVLLLTDTHALVAHVGSGRVYLGRDGQMHLLTEDHTQLASLRRMGKPTGTPEEEARAAKRLTRAVGFREDVKVDLLEVELAEGDRFLLLTDGVWGALEDSALENLSLKAGTVESVVAQLHEEVRKRQPKDNFTTLLVQPRPKVEDATVSPEQKIKMLGRVPALEFLSYQDLIRVISTGDLLKMRTDQVVCREGDAGGEMMLIVSGAAEVQKNGKTIGTLGRGDVFGEMSMLDAAPRSATITTTAPTHLLAFPRDALFSLLREEPELAVKFLWGVTMEMNKRLRSASNQLVGVADEKDVGKRPRWPLPFHRSLG